MGVSFVCTPCTTNFKTPCALACWPNHTGRSKVMRLRTCPKLSGFHCRLLQINHRFRENPYWYVFTGGTHLQLSHQSHPSSQSRWRKRLGEAGVDQLLAQRIEAAKHASAIKPPASSASLSIRPLRARPLHYRLIQRCWSSVASCSSKRQAVWPGAPSELQSPGASPCPPLQAHAPCLAGSAIACQARAARHRTAMAAWPLENIGNSWTVGFKP